MRLTDEQVEALRAIETDGRKLQPRAVIEAARDKKNPLHPLFEWNVKAAAERDWMHTAREIIGAVTILITTTTHSIKAPAYVRDPAAGQEQGYQHTEVLRRDPEQARESLLYTLEVAAGHLRRAFDLASAVGLETEIDQLLARVMGVQRQIKNAA